MNVLEPLLTALTNAIRLVAKWLTQPLDTATALTVALTLTAVALLATRHRRNR